MSSWLFISFFLFLLPFSETVEFKIDTFKADDTDILYTGDAVLSVGAIEFNKVNYMNRVGQAIYYDTVPIWDRKSRQLTDFTTHFTFFIDIQGRSTYGNGFTFFLAPVTFQIPPNSAGGFLGLFNTTNSDSSRNQMIVIEFDSFVNPEWDPPFEHVGINKNSIRSVNYTAWDASLHSGETADAWVTYNAATQILNVRWSYGNDSQEDVNTSLSYQVDLREVLPEWVMIGFSAATGANVERHVLQSWEFNSSLNIVERGKDNSREWKLFVEIAVPVVVLALVTMIICGILWRKRPKHVEEIPVETTVPLTSINDDLERGAGPKRFSYCELVSATNDFSKDRKLGEGGFGCVYKGYLSRENMVVAVKKISPNSTQGKKEYITEVKVISSLRHRNLVRLIGWCHDQTQFLLVYEFMPKGSLDSHLFSKKSPPLKWDVRYNIAMGLASALLYLHEEGDQCVVHCDIKTSNIMLDSGFNVKLGDFGMARFMDHELGSQITVIAGTRGYMAPEYETTGKSSKESDVYSFGVVAIEIACGRKVMDRVDPGSDLKLVQWVWNLLGNGELISGVDQRLNRVFDSRQAECLMMVGLWCAHPDRSFRPSIRQAIQVLKFEGAAPNLLTRMPMLNNSGEPEDAPSSSSGAASITYTSADLIR